MFLIKDKYYDFNFLPYYPKTNFLRSVPCSYIFKLASKKIKFNNDLLRDLKIFKKFKRLGLTVWGIKKKADEYSIEYYFYYPEKYPKNNIDNLIKIFNEYETNDLSYLESIVDNSYYMISINPTDNQIDEMNLYRKNSSNLTSHKITNHQKLPINLAFTYDFGSKKLSDGNLYFAYPEGNLFHQAFKKIKQLLEEFHPNYEFNEEKIFTELLELLPYLKFGNGFTENFIITPSGVCKKTNKCVGLYFIGLNLDQLISFLKHHNYEEKFIKSLKSKHSRLSHIRFDLGVDILFLNNKFTIYKTSFYGSV